MQHRITIDAIQHDQQLADALFPAKHGAGALRWCTSS